MERKSGHFYTCKCFIYVIENGIVRALHPQNAPTGSNWDLTKCRSVQAFYQHFSHVAIKQSQHSSQSNRDHPDLTTRGPRWAEHERRQRGVTWHHAHYRGAENHKVKDHCVMVRVHNTFPVRVLMDDKLVSDVAVPFFLPLTGKFFLFECTFFWWIAVGRYIYLKKKKVKFHPTPSFIAS